MIEEGGQIGNTFKYDVIKKTQLISKFDDSFVFKGNSPKDGHVYL